MWPHGPARAPRRIISRLLCHCKMVPARVPLPHSKDCNKSQACDGEATNLGCPDILAGRQLQSQALGKMQSSRLQGKARRGWDVCGDSGCLHDGPVLSTGSASGVLCTGCSPGIFWSWKKLQDMKQLASTAFSAQLMRPFLQSPPILAMGDICRSCCDRRLFIFLAPKVIRPSV